jgi:hypothetical protein
MEGPGFRNDVPDALEIARDHVALEVDGVDSEFQPRRDADRSRQGACRRQSQQERGKNKRKCVSPHDDRPADTLLPNVNRRIGQAVPAQAKI